MTTRKLAVILAGGKGTRLAPYTAVFPKPLVPIGNYPIVDILVRQLALAGFSELVFSVGHLAELIEAYFHKHPLQSKGVKFRYVHEDQPLGTAGSLATISDLPDKFLVLNGDVLTTLDLNAFFAHHLQHGAMLTIATHRRPIRLQYGVLNCRGSEVVGYDEKPTLDYIVSMGIYGYCAEALKYFPKNQRFDLPDLVLKLIANQQKVEQYSNSAEWLDIGNPDDYAAAQELFARDPSRYNV